MQRKRSLLPVRLDNEAKLVNLNPIDKRFHRHPRSQAKQNLAKNLSIELQHLTVDIKLHFVHRPDIFLRKTKANQKN
jgi:hypothetical protein